MRVCWCSTEYIERVWSTQGGSVPAETRQGLDHRVDDNNRQKEGR